MELTDLSVFASLILACVLAFSALGKLQFDPHERTRHMHAMGLPTARIVPFVARLLPYAELALAAALMVSRGWAYRVSALLTAALMVCYLGVVSWIRASGRRAACPCFGPPKQITGWTLLRNAWFLGLSFAASWPAYNADRPILTSLADHPAPLTLSIAALLTVGLIRTGDEREDPTHERDYIRFPIPHLEAWQQGVGSTDLPSIAMRGATLLVIADHRTESGGRLTRRIPTWRDMIPDIGVYAVVRSADREWKADRSESAWHRGYILDQTGQIYQHLGVEGHDSMGLVLGADGLLAGGPVFGSEHIDRLVRDIEEQLREAHGHDPLPPSEDGPTNRVR